MSIFVRLLGDAPLFRRCALRRLAPTPRLGLLVTLCGVVLLLWLNPHAQAAGALAPSPVLLSAVASQSGAAAVVGESLEPCATDSTTAGAMVLSPGDDWQSALENAAPGTTLLLRGGSYQATDKVTIKTGQPGQPVTVKPYNCEAVTLRGSFTPLSHTVLAGLRIEGAGLETGDLNYVIRVDAKNKGALRNLVIRNNTIVGGEVDAIRVHDDVVGLEISGNNIDGGKGGHNLFVTTEVTPIDPAKSPDAILITNNRFTKRYFQTPAEDMFQVRDARRITFTHNSCEQGVNMEQCVDIKSVTAPLTIQHNRFDGATLHQQGAGEDGSSGCMVIHEFDGHPENHLIEANYFRNCRDTVIRFASEGGAANSSGTVRYNIFVNPDSSDDDGLLIWRAENVIFAHNTMIRGTLKLGRGDGLSKSPPVTPRDTVLTNNLFYHTRIDDNTQAPDFAYRCSHNLFFNLTEAGNNPVSCSHTVTGDPLLAALASEVYTPATGSPACGSGENGADRGALACATGTIPIVTPTPGPTLGDGPQLYLPLIQQGP
jgi:hypothetical protein